jgi:hypothetical protein
MRERYKKLAQYIKTYKNRGGDNVTITINNYIPELVGLNDIEYTNYLEELIHKLSFNQPYKWMIKGSINNASKPFVSAPNRDKIFRKLLNYDLSNIATETFEQLNNLLPSTVEDISCHIIPAIESKGGGACYAPGKILLALRIDELSPVRLKRNIAHEYSHTIRTVQKPTESESGFGNAVPYSVRDYLIFEGLANVIPDILYPHQEFKPLEITAEQEINFWDQTNLDAFGMDAYIQYMGIRAYEIGARIIRSYLLTHEISIIEAHYKTDEDLYWNSGYKRIR